MGWADAPVIAAPAAPPAWAAAPELPPATTGDSIAQGLRDPVDAGAQLLTNVLPRGFVEGGNRLNNWLADKTGLVGRLPEGGVDQQVREQNALYDASRGPNSGFDWVRTATNVLHPANLAMGAVMPVATTIRGGLALGAGAGALGGAMTPATGGEDFATEKLKQIGMGAAGGAAAVPVAGAVGRVISPAASRNPQIQALRAEGVRPTVGQTIGGMANRVEERLTSVPVVGDMISNARRGAAEDLNRAAYNRALAPIGQRLPANTTGREAVEFTENALSSGYDRLLPHLTGQADQPFTQGIANLRQMVNTGAIDPTAAAAFNRILDNDVLVKFGGQGAMTGETLKRVESDLGQHVRRLAQSTDADQRLVGDALQQVQAELRDMVVRNNPTHAPRLQELNTGWANFKRVQRAASMVGAEDGVFSAAQLQSAVKATDRSKDKAAFARGDALMQDLSDAGKAVLGSKVPNSGTPERLMLAGGLSHFMDPTGIAQSLIGAGTVGYLRPVQNALTYGLTQRPQSAQPAANALSQFAPALGLLGGQVAPKLLER